jgi:hypothetical protein
VTMAGTLGAEMIIDPKDWMRRLRELYTQPAYKHDWEAVRETNLRWEALRERYARVSPYIIAGKRVSPYIVDWGREFTPIEAEAWNDIRRMGMPFYPQYPVLRYFIDFADPHKKIGLELDGAQYHSAEKDTPRDEALWEQGWRIFRVPGREAFISERYPNPFLNERWAQRAREYPSDFGADVKEFLCRTGEGLLYALDWVYYAQDKRRYERWLGHAYSALSGHRLVQFPLTDDE